MYLILVLYGLRCVQHKVTRAQDLLNQDGKISEEGYSTNLIWGYDRKKIHASWLRIKEWDYYYILNQNYGLTLTIADLGYIGFAAIAFLDFESNTVDQFDKITLLPRGNMNFPSSSAAGDLIFKSRNLEIKFEVNSENRSIYVDSPKFKTSLGKGLTGKLVLEDKKDDSIAIATSWAEDRKKFYYNQKINCFPVSGSVEVGGEKIHFDPNESFAGLDWGRGNWTYKNRWYWASASGKIGKDRVGWNLGYGFTDRTPATENMVFYNGVGHKLEDVSFNFNPKNYMEPWKFTSSDGRFEMDFKPRIDRFSSTNLLLIKSVQHQVFGDYSGFFILDDGTEVKISNFLGFAEDVLNWW